MSRSAMFRQAAQPRTFESLESRIALTVAAEVVNGNLIVSGEADGAVAIVGSANGNYSITDNGVEVGSVSGVTRNVRVTLPTQDANDAVSIDLGENSVRNLYVNLGSGDNELTVSNGTIKGATMIRANGGDDSVSLAADLMLANEANVWLGDGANDLDVASQLSRSLAVKTGAGNDYFSMAPGSSIARNLNATLGEGDNFSVIDGAIGRNLSLTAGAGDDIATLSDLATVGRNATISLGEGDNKLDQAGTINDGLLVKSGTGDDELSLASSSQIGGSAALLLGSGVNVADIDGIITRNLMVEGQSPSTVLNIPALDVADTVIVGRAATTTASSTAPLRIVHLQPTQSFVIYVGGSTRIFT